MPRYSGGNGNRRGPKHGTNHADQAARRDERASLAADLVAELHDAAELLGTPVAAPPEEEQTTPETAPMETEPTYIPSKGDKDAQCKVVGTCVKLY